MEVVLVATWTGMLLTVKAGRVVHVLPTSSCHVLGQASGPPLQAHSADRAIKLVDLHTRASLLLIYQRKVVVPPPARYSL